MNNKPGPDEPAEKLIDYWLSGLEDEEVVLKTTFEFREEFERIYQRKIYGKGFG